MQETSTSPAVHVQGLSHRFGDRQALRGVTLVVGSGEIVGLLGPNGGGKTTLFRILATLLAPTTGEASIFGRSVTRDAAGVRRDIGVVFQRPALDPMLTVVENLKHHGHLYGIRGALLKTRCTEAMEALGIADRARDLVDTLSGGLARRVELAKVLVHHPRLLLLDEPSSGLDPNARRDLFTQLRAMRDEGTTVLLTTHFMEEAERCDRVGILDRGRLVALDTPQHLKEQVGDAVVVVRGPEPDVLYDRIRERFGASPMLVDGAVRMTNGRPIFDDLVAAFPGAITSVTWGHPTLDDVFVHLTGHRFGEVQP